MKYVLFLVCVCVVGCCHVVLSADNCPNGVCPRVNQTQRDQAFAAHRSSSSTAHHSNHSVGTYESRTVTRSRTEYARRYGGSAKKSHGCNGSQHHSKHRSRSVSHGSVGR